MRLIRLLAAFACLAVGVAVGALNPQYVSLDFGAMVLRAPLGVAILAAVLVGVVAGGTVVAMAVVLPLRSQLRRARSAAASRTAGAGLDGEA